MSSFNKKIYHTINQQKHGSFCRRIQWSVLCGRQQCNVEQNGYIPYTSPLHPPFAFVCNFEEPLKTAITVIFFTRHHCKPSNCQSLLSGSLITSPCPPFAAPIVGWLHPNFIVAPASPSCLVVFLCYHRSPLPLPLNAIKRYRCLQLPSPLQLLNTVSIVHRCHCRRCHCGRAANAATATTVVKFTIIHCQRKRQQQHHHHIQWSTNVKTFPSLEDLDLFNLSTAFEVCDVGWGNCNLHTPRCFALRFWEVVR